MGWKENLDDFFTDDTVIIGIGSELKSDDRVGVYITEKLSNIPGFNVIVAGMTPEHWLGKIAKSGYRKLLIIDAVEHDASPGNISFFGIDDLSRRFGLTHTSTLHLFTDYLKKVGEISEVGILAVQPENLSTGDVMSGKVLRSAEEVIFYFKELKFNSQDF